jgi:hypothetical protein
MPHMRSALQHAYSPPVCMLQGGLLVSLLRAVLRLLASLLEGLEGCAGDTPGRAASPPRPGRKEGPGAVALGCCDALLAAGLLSQGCWPAPDQLGVVGPREVALVTDLLAEARGQVGGAGQGGLGVQQGMFLCK